MMKLRTLPLLTILTSTLASLAHAQPAEHPARAELLADVSAIAPGEPFTLGVKLTMQPHWHVYWLNPGDSGEPPAVEWNAPEGFEIGQLQFPVPTKFEQAGGLVGYGYEDEVLLLVTVTPPGGLHSGDSVTIEADVSWLVCDPNVCVPGGEKLSIELPVSQPARPAHQDVFDHWRARIPQPPGNSPAVARIIAPSELDLASRPQKIAVQWEGAAEAIDWFPPQSQEITFSTIEVTSEGANTTIRFSAEALAGKSPQAQTLESVLAYSVGGQRKGLLIPLQVAPPPDASAAKRVSNP